MLLYVAATNMKGPNGAWVQLLIKVPGGLEPTLFVHVQDGHSFTMTLPVNILPWDRRQFSDSIYVGPTSVASLFANPFQADPR